MARGKLLLLQGVGAVLHANRLQAHRVRPVSEEALVARVRDRGVGKRAVSVVSFQMSSVVDFRRWPAHCTVI